MENRRIMDLLLKIVGYIMMYLYLSLIIFILLHYDVFNLYLSLHNFHILCKFCYCWIVCQFMMYSACKFKL